MTSPNDTPGPDGGGNSQGQKKKKSDQKDAQGKSTAGQTENQTVKSETTTKQTAKVEVFQGKLSDRIVTVYVGQLDSKWFLHEKILINASKFFAGALQGSFKEAKEGILRLPEDDPSIFDMVVRWLYTASAMSSVEMNLKSSFDQSTTSEGLRLYVFASKYLIPDLCNMLVDVIYKQVNSGLNPPPMSSVQYIYDNTPEQDGMRKLLVTAFTSGIFYKDWKGTVPNGVEAALATHGEIGRDIVCLLYQWQVTWIGCKGKKGLEPSSCFYHSHPDGKKCPS